MLGSAEKVMVHGGENPAFGAVSGWRPLLALVAWTTYRWRRGRPGTDRTRWRRGGAASTRTGALVAAAGVYLALVVALLLAFGGPVRLHDLLRFRYYTSASDLRLALGIRVLCWAAIALAYGELSPVLGPPQDALLQLCSASAPTCPAFRPPSSIALGPVFARACLLMPLPATFLFGVATGWVR